MGHWETLRDNIRGGRLHQLPEHSEATDQSESNVTGMTELFKIRAKLVEQDKDSKMSRLNMVAIKADHKSKLTRKQPTKLLSSKDFNARIQPKTTMN